MNAVNASRVVTAIGEVEWRARCAVLAAEAAKGDGLSYQLFCQRFTSAMDIQLAALPVEIREIARAIATTFGYGDTDADDNACMHGIDRGCCPAGCE